ncbi:MAG: hypothetical protein IKG21_13225 [Atopobiaceae bacterium]|nr:hypothetical protein [Atopobiaceae bacterium]
MKWYHGTFIVGTSSVTCHTSKYVVFNDDVKPDEFGKATWNQIDWYEASTAINIGDKFFNWETGHIYVCTANGKYMSDQYARDHGRNDQAKWRYDRTQLLNKPDKTVTGLTVSRNNGNSHTMTAKWKIPKNASDEKSSKRATNVSAYVIINESSSTNDKFALSTPDMATTATLNLSSMTAQDGKTKYARKSFYPLASKKLTSVKFFVALSNRYGSGSSVSSAYKFKAPRKPTLSSVSWNHETGRLTCTVKTDAGQDAQERYDTRYRVIVNSTANGNSTVDWKTSKATSFTITYDVQDQMQIGYVGYVLVTFEAYARGYAGDSEHVKTSFYVGWPPKPQFSEKTEGKEDYIVVPNDKDETKITAYIKTNASTSHPVTGVRLQKIVDVPYATAASIPASAWEASGVDTAAVDNGSCKALALAVEDLRPSPGTYTWVRIKSWRAAEDSVFVRYSEPQRVKQLETPALTAADDTVTVYSIGVGPDGESAVVELAWVADDSNACELSWAADADTWNSTEEPDTFVMEDGRWASTGSWTKGGKTYTCKAKVTIRGLEEGEPTFVRARRMAIPADKDGTTVYGKYCNVSTVTPAAPPESAVLSAPSYATRTKAKGATVAVSWAHEGGGTQTAWSVHKVSGASSTQVASGRDAAESAKLTLAATAELFVRLTCVGGTIDSNTVKVVVETDPTLSAFMPEVTTSQGQPVALMVDKEPVSYVACTLTAQGSHGEGPTGDVTQVAGDVVWTDAVTPVWYAYSAITNRMSVSSSMSALESAEDALAALSPGDAGYDEAAELVSKRLAELAYSYAYEAGVDFTTRSAARYAAFRLPAGLDLRDLATYVLAAKAVGGVYQQLASETVTCETAVAWAHQAPAPPNTIDVAPYDETDANGFRELGATILLEAPTGAAATDTYDVYRVRVDGVTLVAEGVEPGKVVRDRYAPFGDALLAYRIACRTADGDVDWLDVPYRLDAAFARIDWAGGYVVLPYDLAIDHRYEKDFEVRHHVGQTLPEGYWGEGRDRGVTITADLVRAMSDSDRARLHELGTWPGPCLVRCADGSCFEAHVDVGGMPVRHDSQAVAVSLSLTEIAPTGLWLAEVEDPPEDEG